jgi:hypothetical protein
MFRQAFMLPRFQSVQEGYHVNGGARNPDTTLVDFGERL